jgi:hypothetical protein
MISAGAVLPHQEGHDPNPLAEAPCKVMYPSKTVESWFTGASGKKTILGTAKETVLPHD